MRVVLSCDLGYPPPVPACLAALFFPSPLPRVRISSSAVRAPKNLITDECVKSSFSACVQVQLPLLWDRVFVFL